MLSSKNIFFFFLLFMSLEQAVLAACSTPSGVTGQIQYISADMKFCDGTNWVTMTNAATATACTSPGMIVRSGSNVMFCQGGTNVLVKMNNATSDGACTSAGMLSYRNSTIEFCDGTTWYKTGAAAGCVAGSTSITITGAGTFTMPAGCTNVSIEAWGAGGAGSAARSNLVDGTEDSGPGGGSGGFTSKSRTTTALESISYSVGAGGTSHGGVTTVDGMTAGGGKKNVSIRTVVGGAGGTATGGTINTAGSAGSSGISQFTPCSTDESGGNGANAPNSGGLGGIAGAPGLSGASGSNPGAGGGGGGLSCAGPTYGGLGNGASGQIKFTYN